VSSDEDDEVTAEDDEVTEAVLRVVGRHPDLGDPLLLVADLLWPSGGVDQVHGTL